VTANQLDCWTLILGPKFSQTERKEMNLSRFYAIGQIEYCRNFIFKRNFPIHKIFERGCEAGSQVFLRVINFKNLRQSYAGGSYPTLAEADPSAHDEAYETTPPACGSRPGFYSRIARTYESL
jgi:hypothetical protein